MTNEQILAEAAAVYDDVVEFRRHLHQFPELSFKEHKTAAYISSILTREGIEHSPIVGTGLLAKIEGEGDLKSAVVLRADIDALPIEEKTGLSFASQNSGIMHGCGHDMHTAVLLGALIVLNRNRAKIQGTLLGLFQPAEEINPGGALAIMNANPFEEYNIRAFLGEHIDTDLPAGTFGFKPNEYMASSDDILITVKGSGGHGAVPHLVQDPVVAAAAIVISLQQIVSRLSAPLTTSVVSIGKVAAEGTTNVIPDKVRMEALCALLAAIGVNVHRSISLGLLTMWLRDMGWSVRWSTTLVLRWFQTTNS